MNNSHEQFIIHRMIKDFLIMFWSPISVFLLHIFLARVVDAYTLFPRIDIPLHFLGGVSIAYSLSLTLRYLQKYTFISQLDNIIEAALILTSTATIAVLWEFAEFILDQARRTNIQVSLSNTIQDLFIGIMGALTIALYKFVKKL